MRRERKCYFCGEPAVNDQHVPGRQFFGENPPINLIKVPSCEKHNQDIAGEEGLFRAWAVGSDGVNERAKHILLGKILSESGRRHAPYKSIRDNTIPVNLITEGISRPGGLLTIEPSIANEFLKRTTRGLLYELYPHLWTVALWFSVGQLNGPQPSEKARNAVINHRHLLSSFEKGDAFACWHHVWVGPEKWISLWGYMFYQRVEFAVVCTNECRTGFWD